jgi:hypothetical protein
MKASQKYKIFPLYTIYSNAILISINIKTLKIKKQKYIKYLINDVELLHYLSHALNITFYIVCFLIFYFFIINFLLGYIHYTGEIHSDNYD